MTYQLELVAELLWYQNVLYVRDNAGVNKHCQNSQIAYQEAQIKIEKSNEPYLSGNPSWVTLIDWSIRVKTCNTSF